MFVFKRQRPRDRSQELTLNLSESWCLYIFLFLQILELEGKPLQSHNEELKKMLHQERSLKSGKAPAWCFSGGWRTLWIPVVSTLAR